MKPEQQTKPQDYVLVVNVEGNNGSVYDSGNIPDVDNVLWSIAGIGLVGGRYSQVSFASGQSSKGFWREIESQIRTRKSLLIVSTRTLQTWHKLRLWEAIESHLIEFGSPNTGPRKKSRSTPKTQTRGNGCTRLPRSSGSVTRSQEANNGYMILSAPPSIIRFRMGNDSRWIRWIGIENFGIGCETDGLSLQEGLSVCQKTVIEMLNAMYDMELGGKIGRAHV